MLVAHRMESVLLRLLKIFLLLIFSYCEIFILKFHRTAFFYSSVIPVVVLFLLHRFSNDIYKYLINHDILQRIFATPF